MIRCTIDMVPHGDEERRRTVGIVEIANVGGTSEIGNYVVVLKKTPPWRGALKQKWRSGLLRIGDEDAELISGTLEGFHRQKRGPYDLLFCALKACGLDRRNHTIRAGKEQGDG